MREIKLKPDGTWRLTPQEVEWLNGAAEREAALRTKVEEQQEELRMTHHALALARGQIEELTREVEKWKQSADDYAADCRRLVAQREQAEARLAIWQAAESLPDCRACAALDAAREQPTQEPPRTTTCPNCGREASINGCDFCELDEGPTQEPLPLGHEYLKCRCHVLPQDDCCGDGCHRRSPSGLVAAWIPCGQPESAHQPTQEKPEVIR
jgi:hypothetical protein